MSVLYCHDCDRQYDEDFNLECPGCASSGEEVFAVAWRRGRETAALLAEGTEAAPDASQSPGRNP